MKCMGKTKKSGSQEKVTMEESDSEDSEDLNKETNGENNYDEIRVPIESKNEEIIVEKTKRKNKYRNKKETGTTKGKRMSKFKEEDINNASEDEDDTESELEEELKKLRKVKIKRAEEDKKQQR
ncbi:hypothetical protein Tco_0049717, partial [Tanacetum coccineum]